MVGTLLTLLDARFLILMGSPKGTRHRRSARGLTSPRRRLATLHQFASIFDAAPQPRSSARRSAATIRWRDVIALADELGIGPAVWRAVSCRDDVPAYAADALRERYRANAIRNVRFRDQLGEAVRALNRAGTEPLLFKGALQLCDGTLETIGDRWMADLDVVIRGGEIRQAESALRNVGYRPEPGKPFAHPHEVPFFGIRGAGPIEVHLELGSPPIPDVLPVTAAWERSSPLSIAGASARALSPTDQVLHNVLHSAVQDLNHVVGGLPFRQLLVLSSLARAHGDSVDWEAIQRIMQAHGLGGPLRGYVWLAHRFCGMPLPAGNWAAPARWRDAQVMSSFALGWPADLQRNLRYAFGRAYLDSLYQHGDRPGHLAVARIRHAAVVLSQNGRSAIEQALVRRA